MRRLPLWQRLSVQITVPILLLITLSFMSMTYFLSRDQQADAYARAEIELRSMLVVAQGSLNRIMSLDRPDSVAEILSEMYVHPRIRNAAIIDSDFQLMHYYVVNQIRPELQKFVGELSHEALGRAFQTGMTIIEYHPEHKHFLALVPILPGAVLDAGLTRNVLVLEYAYDHEAIGLHTFDVRDNLLIFGLLVGLGFLLWLGLYLGVNRPIRAMVQASSQLAQRQPISITLSKRYYNELGVLSRALQKAAKARDRYERDLQRLSSAVEQSSDSILITDLDGKIEYVNQAFLESTGYSRVELIGENPNVLASGRTPAATYESLWQTLRAGETWRGELFNQTRDGTELREWVTISPLRNEHGEINYYLATKQNITEKRASEERIHFLAYFDQLTGLANRALIKDLLDQFIAEGSKSHQGAILLFDLDGMQRLNDVRGFEFGDQALLTVSERLKRGIDGFHGAQLGNLGGDLFVVLLPPKFPCQEVNRIAGDLAERLLASIAEPMSINDEPVTLTASAGLIYYPHAQTNAEELLRYTETAVFKSKQAGGNRCTAYSADLSAEIETHFNIDRDLRAAIGTEQLQLYVQPKHLVTGEMVGVEVLCRWQHPERGFIPPDVFIAVAEKSSLIVKLGDWIQAESLRLLANLPAPLNLALNISPRQFRQEEFSTRLQQDLELSGADPKRLTIEVTENLLLDDVHAVSAKMRELSRRGIEFSIDDFGTGYSSLSYLSDLPLQELKIDRHFVMGIGNPRQEKIVDMVISMSEHMNLRVVAEGVETKEQVDYLLAESPQIICQGYYFSKPLPVQNLSDYIHHTMS
ncbi:MAG: EAL domain-containing protein [Aliidiomarina sp.]|uniref:putative bifunctional diguanylate cyclase/phosphodiesterase n=1 Tax=Aliidiomarina sp. TaxID=1872439 RepID=UPI0025BC1F75|nr:EAL domain-containing protein [Aliidiomarina sp.]MCH8500886.1 EAL domain-containing protein [Aliidiomarina sp.]